MDVESVVAVPDPPRLRVIRVRPRPTSLAFVPFLSSCPPNELADPPMAEVPDSPLPFLRLASVFSLRSRSYFGEVGSDSGFCTSPCSITSLPATCCANFKNNSQKTRISLDFIRKCAIIYNIDRFWGQQPMTDTQSAGSVRLSLFKWPLLPLASSKIRNPQSAIGNAGGRGY